MGLVLVRVASFGGTNVLIISVVDTLVACYWPGERQVAIDCHASCKSWLTGATGTVFVLEQQDRPALR